MNRFWLYETDISKSVDFSTFIYEVNTFHSWAIRILRILYEPFSKRFENI